MAELSDLKVLNRDVIKYIAMVTMLLNHIAHVFLTPGTILYAAFEDIGYFTAPTMCYFLVEGYSYTRSKVKYGLRLFLFAVLSQIPYHLALGFGNLNMIFTLFCCFLILAARDKIAAPSLSAIACTVLVLVTAFSDWSILAAVYTLMFAGSIGDKERLKRSYLIAAALFAVVNTMSLLAAASMSQSEQMPVTSLVYTPVQAVLSGILSCVGVLASAAVILVFYNGKRAERGKMFAKWFFYLFYPGHLLALYLIKCLTGESLGL